MSHAVPSRHNVNSNDPYQQAKQHDKGLYCIQYTL